MNALGPAVPTRTDLEALLKQAAQHVMTPEELQAQRESFARGMGPCEHGVYDFETCPDCRGWK